MKPALLTLGYCTPIIQYAVMAQAEGVIFEAQENFQKQSYRTRTRIATSTGILTLTVPIKHRADKKQKRQMTFGIQLENKFHWQRDHWRSLRIAYQTSPYFEYYEDDFEPLYHTEYNSLATFNLACQKVILEALQLEIEPTFTEEYFKSPTDQQDLRHLIVAKNETNYGLPEYHQHFIENHGFLPNVTILDLLFNLGPSALDYLEKVDLSGLS